VSSGTTTKITLFCALGFHHRFVKFQSHSKTHVKRYGERVTHHNRKVKVVSSKFGMKFKHAPFVARGEQRQNCRGDAMFLVAPDGEQLKRANSPSRRVRLYQA
jgi:hypothetical protein